MLIICIWNLEFKSDIMNLSILLQRPALLRNSPPLVNLNLLNLHLQVDSDDARIAGLGIIILFCHDILRPFFELLQAVLLH